MKEIDIIRPREYIYCYTCEHVNRIIEIVEKMLANKEYKLANVNMRCVGLGNAAPKDEVAIVTKIKLSETEDKVPSFLKFVNCKALNE